MLPEELIGDEQDRLIGLLASTGIETGDLDPSSVTTPRLVVVDFVTVARQVGNDSFQFLGYTVQLVVARRERVGTLFARVANVLLANDYTIVGPLTRVVDDTPIDNDVPTDYVQLVAVTKVPRDVF